MIKICVNEKKGVIFSWLKKKKEWLPNLLYYVYLKEPIMESKINDLISRKIFKEFFLNSHLVLRCKSWLLSLSSVIQQIMKLEEKNQGFIFLNNYLIYFPNI